MKEYDEKLVAKIKDKQYYTLINNINVLVKPIPDLDIDGVMDLRLYNRFNMQKIINNYLASLMMNIIPKSFFTNHKYERLIDKFRVTFNEVKSIDCNSKVNKEKRIIKGLDNNDLPIYIYKPINKKNNLKVLYFIHGGGFLGGSHRVVEEFVKMIVSENEMLVVSIDYRLAPKYPYPKAFDDVLVGYKWLMDNIKTYGGNIDEIYVSGDSAGGNLAHYVASNGNIKGQILLYPTVNIAMIKDNDTKFSWSKFNINIKEKYEIKSGIILMKSVAKILTKILVVDSADNEVLTPYNYNQSGLCKTLIVFGEHDYFMIESLAFAKKLLLNNVNCRTILYKGLGHAFIDSTGIYPQVEDLVKEIGLFVNE